MRLLYLKIFLFSSIAVPTAFAHTYWQKNLIKQTKILAEFFMLFTRFSHWANRLLAPNFSCFLPSSDSLSAYALVFFDLYLHYFVFDTQVCVHEILYASQCCILLCSRITYSDFQMGTLLCLIFIYCLSK